MEQKNETAFLTMIQHTVEQHGCTIESVDFESHVINLDGPDEAVEACAKAIAGLLD